MAISGLVWLLPGASFRTKILAFFLNTSLIWDPVKNPKTYTNLFAGQNLTIGVSEVVEGDVVTGSARIVNALVTSLQLGFGLMIGEQLAWWLPKLEPKPCGDPNISPWFLAIW